MFRNAINNLSKLQKTIIIIVSLAFIGIIVAAIIFINQPTLAVKITNYKNYLADAPGKEIDNLETTILHLIKNTTAIPENTTTIDGVIREDSFTDNEISNIHNTNFILDIDSLKLSYKIGFSYSRSEEIPDGVSVECPIPSQMKYPETNCIGMYNTSANAAASQVLPYESNRFNISLNPTDDTPSLTIIIKTCSDKLYEQYKQEALAWLASHSVDTSKYELNYFYSHPCY